MSRKAAASAGKRKVVLSACVKYKLTLEYDGTGFSGWQVQKNARSVQGALIDAAHELFGTAVDLQGAGRTDAGVHALAQVAHLEAPRRILPKRLLQELNDLLPAPINILNAEETSPDFHARHDAVARSYLYLISRRRTAFGKRYVWWVRDKLDLDRMQAVADGFRGLHDFSAFADKRIDKHLSTTVKIDRSEVVASGEVVLFRIVGSHFLWRMVRRLVGILVEAGRGTLSEAEAKALLTGRSEWPARFTAPPSGLFLEQVLYEGERLAPLSLPVLPSLLQRRSGER